MDDPPANTYTYALKRQLDEAILKARFDDDVHVIVLRGKGDRFFSAGANIGMLNAVTPGFKYFFCLHANEMLLRLEHTPKLVIAALNGHTVGGGLEIAMAADLRIARKDAGKIGLPEVTLGVLPGTGGTARLAKMVGKSRAIELMVTGNTFSFEEARDMGIVNQVIDATPAEWWEQVMDYARQFVPPNKASKAVGRIKRSVQSGWDLPTESRARNRTRAATASLPERGRQGGHRRQPGEARAEVQGEVKTDLFIGGAFVPAASGKRFGTVNPATGETIAEVAEAGKADLDLAVAAARQAFESGPWAAMKPRQRGAILKRAADLLLSRADQFGEVETRDNGKPIFEAARIDMPAAAECLAYFGESADKLYGETFPGRPDAMLLTLRESVGVVGAITPWNFPLLQAMWKIAPALALGNTVVLKPASATPLTALMFAELLAEAGLPPGAFNVVTGPGAIVGRPWPSIPVLTRSPSRAKPRPVKRSCALRPEASNAFRWSSAASRPTSSSPTPTSKRPRRAPSTPSSTARASCARRARGCSSRSPSTTPWSRKLPSGRGR